MTFPERLKAARDAIGLDQRAMSAQSGVSYSAYQKYEIGCSLPCADAIAGFVQLGINANWLLTGEGPMKLADLHTLQQERAAYGPGSHAINQETLAVVLQGILQARPDAKPAQIASMAVEFYLRLQAMDQAKPDAA
jgi:transcriptional regulator with XRE-family HTH domain